MQHLDLGGGRIVEGDAAQVLLNESKQASRVVLGPHHRKRSRDSALGSVGSAVAAHSETPVVVLCGPAGMPEERAAVVVGVDGTDSSPDILAVGFEHASVHIGKAGRTRWKGRRPHNRGVTMNPVDHPMGGGEGRSSGGRHPCSPWGQPSKGYKTRHNKTTDKFIVRRRKGKEQ